MPVSELSPNPRRSTVEYIADELRDAIMAGRLEPGEQLGEADLARRFEVSRGPLREAMQRLVSEGLLHAITNRGVFVTELTLDDVLDVYRTRSVIERGALEVVLADVSGKGQEAGTRALVLAGALGGVIGSTEP